MAGGNPATLTTAGRGAYLPFSQIYQSLLTSDPDMQGTSSSEKILNFWD